VARLVPGDGREAGAEARHQPGGSEDAEQRALPGECQVALDDQVIGHHRLHPRAAVARIAAHAVGGVDQFVLEDVPKAEVVVLADRLQGSVQAAPNLEHFLEKALEEDRVPSLVRQLGGEEDPLVLLGRGMEDRRQRVGHCLLTDEEQRHRPPHLAADALVHG
jgi:hypothetical protein